MKLGEFMINQLNGGITKMDGGAIFGVVPKPLWSKSIVLIIITKFHLLHILYLFRLEKNIIIDAGLGNAKLTKTN